MCIRHINPEMVISNYKAEECRFRACKSIQASKASHIQHFTYFFIETQIFNFVYMHKNKDKIVSAWKNTVNKFQSDNMILCLVFGETMI